MHTFLSLNCQLLYNFQVELDLEDLKKLRESASRKYCQDLLDEQISKTQSKLNLVSNFSFDG